jgi:hypothetical protein
MYRAVILGAVAYVAYRAGQQQAIQNQYDYYIVNQTVLTGGINATEYVQITQVGVELTSDVNLATPFSFREGNELKQVLRKHNPHFNLILETTNNSLIQTA